MFGERLLAPRLYFEHRTKALVGGLTIMSRVLNTHIRWLRGSGCPPAGVRDTQGAPETNRQRDNTCRGSEAHSKPFGSLRQQN